MPSFTKIIEGFASNENENETESILYQMKKLL